MQIFRFNDFNLIKILTSDYKRIKLVLRIQINGAKYHELSMIIALHNVKFNATNNCKLKLNSEY